jgi:hypothetical protein
MIPKSGCSHPDKIMREQKGMIRKRRGFLAAAVMLTQRPG